MVYVLKNIPCASNQRLFYVVEPVSSSPCECHTYKKDVLKSLDFKVKDSV